MDTTVMDCVKIGITGQKQEKSFLSILRKEQMADGKNSTRKENPTTIGEIEK